MNKKIKDILAKKNKSKIVSLTAYSKNIAQIIDKYVDMTLVGDSMASVLYNYNTTRKISLDTMIEHAKSARMGINNSLMVFDMPYNTYRDKKVALVNAKKIIKKPKSDAIKLEGGHKIKEIVKAAGDNNCSIRVGVNAGSLEKDILEKFKEPCPEALVESALRNIRILENENFDNLKVSVKSSDVFLSIEAYRQLSKVSDYPLHVGITEAGGFVPGSVKSSIGLGTLL